MTVLEFAVAVLGVALVVAITVLDRRYRQQRDPWIYPFWSSLAYLTAIACLVAIGLNYSTKANSQVTTAAWLSSNGATDSTATSVFVAAALGAGVLLGLRRASLGMVLSIIAMAAVTVATTIGQTTSSTHKGLSTSADNLIAVVAVLTLISLVALRTTRVWLVSAYTFTCTSIATFAYPAGSGSPSAWPRILVTVAVVATLAGVLTLTFRAAGTDQHSQAGLPERARQLFTIGLVLAGVLGTVAMTFHHKGTIAPASLGMGLVMVAFGWLFWKIGPYLFKFFKVVGPALTHDFAAADRRLDADIAASNAHEQQRAGQAADNQRAARASQARYEADRSRSQSHDPRLSRSEQNSAASRQRSWESQQRRNS